MYAATPESNENAGDITTMQDEKYELQGSIDTGSETQALPGSLKTKAYEIENRTDR